MRPSCGAPPASVIFTVHTLLPLMGGPGTLSTSTALNAVETENGTVLYFAGDTCVFGDMQLIGRIYEPDIAIIPIGDHYTMGPREAAVALELLGAKRCVPCHWGTFPLLTGTPDALAALAPGVQIERLAPGDSVTV